MIIDYNPEEYYFLDLDYPAEFKADDIKYNSAQDFINKTYASYKELKALILQALLYKYSQNPELRSKLTSTELVNLTVPNSANIYDRYTFEQTAVVQRFMIDKEIRELKSSAAWTCEEQSDLLQECYS